MRVITLRYEGYTNVEIAKITEYTPNYIATLLKKFKERGIQQYYKSNMKGGNHRYLTQEKEKEILSEFEKIMNKGQVIDTKILKIKFDEEIGKQTPDNFIYRLLKRHGYRKVMPRSKHPKKASNEDIKSSKKLKE